MSKIYFNDFLKRLNQLQIPDDYEIIFSNGFCSKCGEDYELEVDNECKEVVVVEVYK